LQTGHRRSAEQSYQLMNSLPILTDSPAGKPLGVVERTSLRPAEEPENPNERNFQDRDGGGPTDRVHVVASK
jgi:hypothetical protein